MARVLSPAQEQGFNKFATHVLDEANGRGTAPAFMGSFPLLFSQVKVGSDEQADANSCNANREKGGLRRGYWVGRRAAHSFDVGAWTPKFNPRVALAGKESPAC